MGLMRAKTEFSPSDVSLQVRLRIFSTASHKQDRDSKIARNDVCGLEIHLKDFGRNSAYGWTISLVDPYGKAVEENMRALNFDDANGKPNEPCWTCANLHPVCDGADWGVAR